MMTVHGMLTGRRRKKLEERFAPSAAEAMLETT